VCQASSNSSELEIRKGQTANSLKDGREWVLWSEFQEGHSIFEDVVRLPQDTQDSNIIAWENAESGGMKSVAGSPEWYQSTRD